MADTPWGSRIKSDSIVSSGQDLERWITVQKNTFTKWANHRLAQRSINVEDIFADFHDGVLLIALLEVLSGERFPRRYTKKPKLRIQKMENLNMAFEYLRGKGLSLVNIGSTDILDGNNKLLLGLIWTLILRFEVADINIGNTSGKEALLLWCKRSLKDYPNVQVDNFGSHWQNGMAFSCLIHKFHPDLIDVDDLKPENDRENLTLAFRTAEERLGIAQLLEVDDIAGVPSPDEKAIITYVSQLFRVFASGQKKSKAVRTVCRAIQIARQHEQWRQEYNSLAIKLNEWLDTKATMFAGASAIRSLADIQSWQRQLSDHNLSEKPAYESSQVNLESLYTRLRVSCFNNGRSFEEPKPSVRELREKWQALTKAETALKNTLRSNYQRFLQIDFELQKFNAGYRKVDTWLDEKLPLLNANGLDLSTTAAVRARIEAFQVFQEHQLPRYMKVLDELKALVQGLPHDHADTAKASEELNSAVDRMAAVESMSAGYQEILQQRLHQHEQLDVLEKECVAQLLPLGYLIEEIEESLTDPIQKNDISTAETALAHFDENITSKITQFLTLEATMMEKVNIIQEGGRSVEMSGIDINALNSKCDEIKAAAAARRQEIESILENARNSDRLCKTFADHVNTFKELCEAFLDDEDNQAPASLEDQLEVALSRSSQHSQASQNIAQWVKELTIVDIKNSNDPTLVEIREQTGPAGEAMVKLEYLNSVLEGEQVIINPYCTETIESVRATWEALGQTLNQQIEQLQTQIQHNKGGHLTPEQLAEIKEVFTYFDTDAKGTLNADEFGRACVSIGFSLEDDETLDAFKAVDSDSDGEITLGEFTTFCEGQMKGGNTKDDVLRAFRDLADGQQLIRETTIASSFTGDYASYIHTHMPKAINKEVEAEPQPVDGSDQDEAAVGFRDYEPFTEAIFSK